MSTLACYARGGCGENFGQVGYGWHRSWLSWLQERLDMSAAANKRVTKLPRKCSVAA
jgi:hypothetical protein